MRLDEFISLSSIHTDVKADSKKTLFKKIANFFAKNNTIKSTYITEKLNERERLGSTGIGNGVAIPHTKIDGIKKTQVIYIKLKTAIDFTSTDNKKVCQVFAIITPENTQSEHLLILSSISNFLKDKSNAKKLQALKNPEEILKLFSKF
jgi:PTS system nitrogen regulatory IIA component